MLALILALLATPTPSPTLNPLPIAQVNWYAMEGAQKSGLDANLIKAVILSESAGDPNAVSKAGAVGLMQLEPDTATDCGVTDRYNALENAICGSKTLAYLIHDVGLAKGIAAYNFGYGNISTTPQTKWPQETKNYVASVISEYDALQHNGKLIAVAPTSSPAPSPTLKTTSEDGATTLTYRASPGLIQFTNADPCKGTHRLVCGPIRFLPSDSTERNLFYGRLLSELVDAFVSSKEMALLNKPYQIVTPFTIYNAQGQLVHGSFVGQPFTDAQVLGANGIGSGTPASLEATSFYRPFASHGFFGYMFAFTAYDIGVNTLAKTVPSLLNLRPLSQQSLNSLYITQIGYHAAGAMSWARYTRQIRNEDTFVATCQREATDNLHVKTGSPAQSSGTFPFTSYSPPFAGSAWIGASPSSACSTIWPMNREPQ